MKYLFCVPLLISLCLCKGAVTTSTAKKKPDEARVNAYGRPAWSGEDVFVQ